MLSVTLLPLFFLQGPLPYPKGRAKHVIRGRVRIDAKLAQREISGVADPDRRFDERTRGLPHVLVTIDGLEKRWRFPPRDAVANLDFSTRVFPLAPGQTFRINQPHPAPFSLTFDSAKGKFTFRWEASGAESIEARWQYAQPLRLEKTKNGDRHALWMRTPKTGRFTSDSHRWLGCDVRLMPHPVFTVTRPDGTFELPPVPPGDYNVVFTHTVLGSALRKVKARTKSTDASIRLRVPESLRQVTSDAVAAPGTPTLSWRLPDSCFVEYTRVKSTCTPPNLRNKLLLGPFPRLGFYADELDDGAVRFSGYSLGELLPQVALSLSGRAPKKGTRSRVRLDFAKSYRAGRVSVTGSVRDTQCDALDSVRQVGDLSVKSTDRKNKDYRLMGKMRFERTVDTKRGRVLAFEAKLTGKIGKLPFEFTESWKLRRVTRSNASDFKKAVNESIQRGETYLKNGVAAWLKPNKRFAPRVDTHKRAIGTGHLALALLTLCKGNPDRSSKPVLAMLAELRKRLPRDTYVLGTSLLALEAFYEPPNEVEQLRQGLIREPQPRKPSQSDLQIMREWVRRLLACRDPSSGSSTLRFRYHGEPSFDNSVTQFAALGLLAAQRCGIELPPDTWHGLASHFLAVQTPPVGDRLQLTLPTYRDLGKTKQKARAVDATPRGFGYTRPSDPYASMTCAGITGLSISRAMIARQGRKRDRRLLGRLDQAIHDAFAWLHENYDIRGNSGKARYWFMYGLYSLERACELSNVARIGARHWYFDGAQQILHHQRADGSWGGETPGTCFALLFLKKSVAPVITR